MKGDPCTEEYCRQAAPYYVPNISAIVWIITGDVGLPFHQMDGARITATVALGKKMQEK
jgi:hypothetical protein